jgi:hypothetical protein
MKTAHLFVVETALVPGPQKVHELWPSLLLTKPAAASQAVQKSSEPVL